MVYQLGMGTLRGAIAVLATGALADQLTRWFSSDPNLVAIVWALLLVAFWQATTRTYATAGFESAAAPRWLVAPTLCAGAAAAGAGYYLNAAPGTPMLYRAAGVLAAVVAAGGAAGLVAAGRVPATGSARYHNWWKRRDSAVLAACMAVAAGMASLTFRASTDDFYYVNLSTYIYEHGVIPSRDTVLSDQVFAGYPRFASWEVLWGVVSRLTHIPPAYLLYLVVIPVATALSIVALAHLIDTTAIHEYKLALVAATTFLVFDGATGFTFGSYQGPRIWQGKSFFLAVLLPMLLAGLLRLLRERTWRTSTDVVLTAIACVGATTSAFVICVPVLVAAAVLALRQRRALAPVLAALGYTAACALVFKSLRHESATTAHALGAAAPLPRAEYSTGTAIPQSYDVLTKLAHPGWHASLFALAVCWGWLALRASHARALVALLVGGWGLIAMPSVLPAVLAATGSQAIAWRFIWLIPIPLLVGASASLVAELAAGGGERNQRAALRAYAAAGSWIALVALAPLLLGSPPWRASATAKMEAEIAKPWSLRVGYGYREAADVLAEIGQPGDVVLARNGLSASINAMSTRFATVAPRPAYAAFALAGVPDGFVPQRVKLAAYVTGDEPVTWQPGELADALRLVRVDVVCVTSDHEELVQQFVELGYTDAATQSRSDGGLTVWCGRSASYAS